MSKKIISPSTFDKISPAHFAGIFLVAMSALVLEFTMTRILSVSLWYHFAFMIISVALLGIGISGVVLSLFPKFFDKPLDKLLTVLSLLYGVSVIVCFMLSNLLPVDPFSLLTQKIQFLLLPVYYLLITIPFFFSGLIISILLTRFKEEVSKLYFFDLLGAGISVFAFAVIVPQFGGNGAIVFVAAFGFLAGAVFGYKSNKHLSLLSFSFTILTFVFLINRDVNLPIRVTPNKIYANYIAQRPDLNVFTAWNTFSKVDVMKEEEPSPDGYDVYLAIIDEGNATTNIPNVKRLPPPTKPADASNLAFATKDSAGKVFILGSGGGGEVLTALYHNAKNITGVEINGILNDLISDVLAGWTGPLIKNNKNVNIITDDARSVIRSGSNIYDVIVSAHTISSSAVSNGAMSMVENYIMTKEAVKEYMKHLDNSGVIYISRPETQVPKLITTLKTASKELGLKQDSNIIVFRRPPNDFETGKSFMAGIVYKKNGFDMIDVLKIRDMANSLSLDIEYDPLTEQEGLYKTLIKSNNLQSEIDKFPGSLTPATDNKPFFDDNFGFADLSFDKMKEVFSQDDKAILALKDKPVAQTTLITMLVQILLVSVVFLLMPAFFIKKEKNGNFEKKFLIYFALIGLGYIILQISLIQKFTLFLGQPVYTMLTVISSMLIASGFGSRYSASIFKNKKNRLLMIFGIIALLSVLIGLFSPPLFVAFSGFSMITRIVISVVIIAPLGFFMGIPFPSGISMMNSSEKRYIGISWAVNGFFSVIGTVLTMILAMTYGFTLLFLLSALIYAVALVFIILLRRN
jgi:hypothetical protein